MEEQGNNVKTKIRLYDALGNTILDYLCEFEATEANIVVKADGDAGWRRHWSTASDRRYASVSERPAWMA